MTYSYTQISQYLCCPRRYRHRYLDGWKEKDTRAAMLFGRAFEQALSAYFQREDAAAVLFREWAAHRDSNLQYSSGTSWDRMLQQGVQLLERFAQDDRVRIRQPRRNLQIKFTRPLSQGNDFVAYVDAIGELDGTRCLLEWKTTASRYPEEPARIAGPRSSAGLLFLGHRHRRRGSGRVRPQATGRDSVLPNHHHRRTTRGVRPTGRGHDPTDRVGPVPAAQRHPLPPEPLHQLPLRRPLPGTAGSGRRRLWYGVQETTLVGLTSLRTRNPPMLPKLNRKRALFVLTKIDEILAWEQRKEAERDTRFVELGRYLCEVRAGQYWRLENLKSFDEFLERRFPESRRKAYYLMSIHEHLPPQARKELKEVGWTKGLELAKVARTDGQEFDCATWLHKARSDAEGAVQAGGGEGTDGAGNGTVGDYLLQAVQEPDSGGRAGA